MQSHHSTTESIQPNADSVSASAPSSANPLVLEDKQIDSHAPSSSLISTASHPTHLHAIPKGRGQLKNVLLALDKDYRDILQQAKNKDYVLAKLPQIENELIRRLKPIFSSAKSDNLRKQMHIIENFYPYIGYLGFYRAANEIFLPMITLDFKYINILACYAVQSHVQALPTDPQKNLTCHLYPWLKVWNNGDSSLNKRAIEPQDIHLANLKAHALLDPILESHRDTFRTFALSLAADALAHGVESHDFKEAVYVCAENYDVGFLQFIIDWITEYKEEPELAQKALRYESLIKVRIEKTIRADEASQEQIFLHLLPKLNIDLDILIPVTAIFKHRVTGNKTGLNVMISPLHLATLTENKKNYDIIVAKVKNINPICTANGSHYPLKDDVDEDHLLHIDDINFSPIHLATHHASPDVLADLIQRGADIEPLTQRGLSPLRLADRYHNITMVKLLLKAYANKYPGSDSKTVQQRRDYAGSQAKNSMKLCLSLVLPAQASSHTQPAASASVMAASLVTLSARDEFFHEMKKMFDADKMATLQKYLDDVNARYENGICFIPTFQITNTVRRPTFSKAEKEISFTSTNFETIVNALGNASYKMLAHAMYHFVKPKYIKEAAPTMSHPSPIQKLETESKKDDNNASASAAAASLSSPTKLVVPDKTRAYADARKTLYVPTKLTTAKEDETMRIQDAINIRKAKAQAEKEKKKTKAQKTPAEANAIASPRRTAPIALANNIPSTQGVTVASAPETTPQMQSHLAIQASETDMPTSLTPPIQTNRHVFFNHASGNSPASDFDEQLRQRIQESMDLIANQETAYRCFKSLNL